MLVDLRPAGDGGGGCCSHSASVAYRCCDKAVGHGGLKPQLQLRFDCNSTALQPFDDPRHDGLQYYGLNKYIMTAASGEGVCVTSL